MMSDIEDVPSTLDAEESRARAANERAEAKRQAAAAARRKRQREETKAERETKARQLDDLLQKSAAFSDILTKKTEVLGRVGSGLDGAALGEHNLTMAQQPKCMVGGTMRDYQLEGLTWMYEICLQGMSGILADEMGLGKTLQTIALIALLREQESYLGPHLIIAPLSTLSNWIDEFRKWVPSIPVVLYHGDPDVRQTLRDTRITRHIKDGRPDDRFPVVCTSYEIILRDRAHLAKINWEFIIIDEGHRMKNFDSKLFRELRTFRSATRLLITGTPLQNNLRELWSLLNFLLPDIFVNWEAFESWFDFSELQDEEGMQEFLADRAKQDLVKKMHLILQPLLLRRIKADVAAYLPKKREYVLYAPMTHEQTDLYNAISDRKTDTRAFLEGRVAEQLADRATQSASTESVDGGGTTVKPEEGDRAGAQHTKSKSKKKENAAESAENALPDDQAGARSMRSKSKREEIVPDSVEAAIPGDRAGAKHAKGKSAGGKNGAESVETTLPIRSSPRRPVPALAKNAFSLMMKGKAPPEVPAEKEGGGAATGKKSPRVPVQKTKNGVSTNEALPKIPTKREKSGAATAAPEKPKRKSPPTDESSTTKSSKSSRRSTPSRSLRRTSRKSPHAYHEANSDIDDFLDDEEFEAKLRDLADKEAAKENKTSTDGEGHDVSRIHYLAKKELANKKLGNPLMQLRLVCNSPHNFYNPFSSGSVPVDESIVTSSGKMLLLDRLLPALFARDHKVLIFSQFQTQLDILEDYCAELRGWPTCRIDGSVAQESRREQIARFNSDAELKVFLLSTRAGGQGINLAAADTVILFDSDWNPQQDLQAQDRCHRIGQTRPVVVFRIATKGTVEESLLMSADAKRRLEKLVIKKGGFRTMSQKVSAVEEASESLDPEALRSLLLRDGTVYRWKGGDILTDEDIRVLCDRSDDAYARAAGGQGDAEGWKVVETGADGIKSAGGGARGVRNGSDVLKPSRAKG